MAFSTGNARAIALGGAYFSAEDDIYSGAWNPASFGPPGYLRDLHAGAFFMPTTTALALRALRSRDTAWNMDERLTERETIFAALWGIKGITLGWRTWVVGFVNSDEPLRRRIDDVGPLSGWNGVTGHTYTLALAFRLSPQVVLGASAAREVRAEQVDPPDTPYVPGGPEPVGYSVDAWGGRFGILLRPKRWLNVGLTYVYRPDGLEGLEDELERIDKRTINGGISLYLWHGSALLVDLRNLDNADLGFGFAEPHVGVEQTLARLVSLRAGWYYVKDSRRNVLSAGIGVKPPWMPGPVQRPGGRVDLLAYTFVWQNEPGDDHFWHMLALTVPVRW